MTAQDKLPYQDGSSTGQALTRAKTAAWFPSARPLLRSGQAFKKQHVRYRSVWSSRRPTPKGTMGHIHMRPRRRYITSRPVLQTPARSGALVKAWNRSLICDPQLLPRRPKHRIRPTRVHGPSGAGRHNRSQLHPTFTTAHLEDLWLTCVLRPNTLVEASLGHRVAPNLCSHIVRARL
jgi:hypothetical protein